MLSLFKVFMSPESSSMVGETLSSGMITQAGKVEEFENKLKEWFEYPYILTLNSATSGLTLAVRMLDLEPDEEILVSSLSCFATIVPVLANNHKIKWLDIDSNTCNIDLDDLKSKITEKTKALVFVHWAGSPLNMDKLEKIQQYTEDKFGFRLKIIEDCAHSLGSEYNGKKLGTHGNTCIFSLQAIKHLTTGDGGLIFLPDEKSYERAKLLRWYGISREKKKKGIKKSDFRLENNISEWGYKFHMNDIAATIGLSNLPYMEQNLKNVRENAEYYNTVFKDVEGVNLLEQTPKSISSYWIYTLKIINKEGFIKYMKDKNIMVSQVHNRCDKHSCVSDFATQLPILDVLESKIISIPVHWGISIENRKYIAKCVIEWCEKNKAKSSYSTNNFNNVLRSLIFTNKPSRIVEFGILNGYSLNELIKSSSSDCKIDAYDLFDEFNGNGADYEIILKKYKDSENVNIKKGDFYKCVEDFKDDSIDILHIDIANDGNVYKYTIENYFSKIKKGGFLILEGGSKERDNVEWMIKYNKLPINPVVEELKLKYDVCLFELYPSMTVIKKL